MRRERRRTTVLASIALAGIAAAIALGLDPRELLAPRTLSVVRTFLGAALRPALVSEAGTPLLAAVLDGVRATVAFAVAGTSLAIVLAVPLAFLASSAWWDEERGRAAGRRIGPAVTAATRVLIAAMRSVHELLWAMLLLAAMGRASATAVIAIAIPYAGTLAKVWSEMIDEAPRNGAAALRGAGGTPAQVWFLALLPRAAADVASYAFYRFECALRSSAVLGFLGFPTLGYHVSLSFENLLYRETWTFLYALIALVLAVELWSAALRRRQGWA